MHKISWQTSFINMALVTAMRSSDPSTKCGAVVVDKDNTIVACGYNGLPRGLSESLSAAIFSGAREVKYRWIVHAEANAIYNAGRHGKSLHDCTIYVTWPPCHECAKAIVQSGIKHVVFLGGGDDDGRWRESFGLSQTIFDSVGVTYEMVERGADDLGIPRLISGNVEQL